MHLVDFAVRLNFDERASDSIPMGHAKLGSKIRVLPPEADYLRKAVVIEVSNSN
jgi:hypothetical protein